jgi:glutaredoxin 3
MSGEKYTAITLERNLGKCIVIEVKVYSKDDCPWCDRAKSLLELHEVKFDEIKIGRDITRGEFLEQVPNVRTVPQIFVNGTRLGGFDDLSTAIKDGSFQNLIS